MSSNHYNHCVSDPGHIPRMILALPWSHSDNNNNNNAIFVRLGLSLLLNANPKSSGSLSATRNITDGSI